MIKLLALDLDGTLLDSRGKISDENKAAVREAEKRGVLVTIATGRRFRDARPVALEIGFNAPIITHNGALLKNAESLESLDFSLLAVETVRDIVRVGKEHGGDALVSADPHGEGTLFYDRVSDDNIPLRKYIAWAESLHGSDADMAVRHVEDLAATDELSEVVHISFSGNCQRMAELSILLSGALGDSVNILPTVYPHLDFTLLDILPPDASKATGVGKLAARHGIVETEIMACGDNFNDLEMLEFAGTPVVMGNASSELKNREGFHTTVSNDEHGVAKAIKTFIL